MHLWDLYYNLNACHSLGHVRLFDESRCDLHRDGRYGDRDSDSDSDDQLVQQRSLLSIMVRTITLNDGKKMPALAWGMGTGGVQKQDTVKLGVQALEAGIVHFDTAQVGDVIGEIATA